jgi:hypothetical protein
MMMAGPKEKETMSGDTKKPAGIWHSAMMSGFP